MARLTWENLLFSEEDWKDFARFVAENWGYIMVYLPGLIRAIQEPNLEKARQHESELNPWRLLGLQDIYKAYHRGAISGGQAYKEALRHGFDAERYQVLHNVYLQRPDLVTLLEMLRRGQTTTQSAAEVLKGDGHDPEWIDRLLALQTRLPTQQEVLTWMIRDVFSPQVRQTLRLDEDYPDAITPFFQQLGLTEEHARNSWAAHWQLPSLTLSFEMLHRGLITEPQLEQILVAADVLPSLRQSIKDAAYRPLTRVDARRMHDMGVLDREQLLQAYRDIGYNDHNAELLVRWTELYNADAEETADEVETKELTRTQILRLYRKGVVSRPETLSNLQRIGYSTGSAEIIVLSTDLDRFEEEQALQIDTYQQRYKAGQISYQDAVSGIASTGLEGTPLEYEIARLGRLQSTETSVPNLGQRNRLLRQGLLPAAQYLELLDREGYSKAWSGSMLESYGVGSTPQEPRPEGRDYWTELYLAGAIDLDEWLERMESVGYPQPWIEYYLSIMPVGDDDGDDGTTT